MWGTKEQRHRSKRAGWESVPDGGPRGGHRGREPAPVPDSCVARTSPPRSGCSTVTNPVQPQTHIPRCFGDCKELQTTRGGSHCPHPILEGSGADGQPPRDPHSCAAQRWEQTQACSLLQASLRKSRLELLPTPKEADSAPQQGGPAPAAASAFWKTETTGGSPRESRCSLCPPP